MAWTISKGKGIKGPSWSTFPWNLLHREVIFERLKVDSHVRKLQAGQEQEEENERLGGEERRLMHLVPAPAVRLKKRRVLSRPGVNSLEHKKKETQKIGAPKKKGLFYRHILRFYDLNLLLVNSHD